MWHKRSEDPIPAAEGYYWLYDRMFNQVDFVYIFEYGGDGVDPDYTHWMYGDSSDVPYPPEN